MKHKILIVARIFFLSFLAFSLYVPSASAQMAEGTYTIDYTVMHSSDPSASIANDYWEKPATLYVENGSITAEMTINHSDWIKEFHIEGKPVEVVSEDSDADTRVNRFNIDGIDSMTEAFIHVIVPDINYDHTYTIRFDFDEESLTAIDDGDDNENEESGSSSTGQSGSDASEGGSETQNRGTESTSTSGGTGEESNPETSDHTPIAGLTVLALVAFAGLFGSRLIRT
ncbi:heme uptake protein IsdC [Geomicrobium sp. JCM 19039]|uniref:heme uptake protein IsdC n=1 Tax=Geomicrobium sp. JCM 19039 TaxID=1460636 RepID=UPI00045F3499|nr:heme uptake protein IsdC [Geomicrobium sp. JCM 19039]GAK13985.1 NPQTN cell wall anchored protein IsdC [Geomicrobium sp. JCM 19039]